MIMKTLGRTIAVGAMLLACSLHQPAVAQTAIEDDPGYVEFSVLSELVDMEPHIEIRLKGSLLRLAAEASRIEDDELADMLLGLRAIYVEGYKLGRGYGEQAEQLRSAARSLTKDLEYSGWDRVAKIREDDSEVHIFVKERGEAIEGLTAMVIDENGEAIFVNIVGEIDPAEIGRIGRKLDIKGLDID